MSCISLLLYKKRELFTLSKFSLLLKTNDIPFSNRLLEAAFYIISLLSKNKAFKSAISYKIIKLVIPLLVILNTIFYFYNKDIIDFLKI